MKTMAELRMVASEVPGYTYGTPSVAKSPLSAADFEQLKQSVGFTSQDEEYLRMAGSVLADSTKQLVETWRGVLSKSPHLAKHSRTPEGQPISHYSDNSGLRFEQWILDTCCRPYDQDWLNYQYEIALRHTSAKKNQTDQVESTPYIPLRDIIAFTAVINETINPFLASKGHSHSDVEKMHTAWCKSLQLQMALWAQPYTDTEVAAGEW